MNLVSNYQRMMDHRLSKPKSIHTVNNGRAEKVFKNSSFNEQLMHNTSFKNKNPDAFDDKTKHDLSVAFAGNFQQYNQLQAP